MKVVVTGGAGFIGAHVCATLAMRPEISDLVVVDDLSTGLPSNIEKLEGTGVRVIVGSVLDSALLEQAFDEADSVVHLAAVSSVPESLLDPARCDRVNVEGTVRVLEAAHRTGARHVVLASSAAVYGACPDAVNREDSPLDPRTPYAVSKLAAEQYAQLYARCFDLDILLLRIFNIFGPGQPPNGPQSAAIPMFLRAALAGEPICLHGDGRQTRDFVHVRTVAEVVADAVCRRVSTIVPVNIGSGTAWSLLGVVSEIESQLGRRLAVRHAPVRLGDIRESRADISRMRQLFPQIEPVGLQIGLSELLAAASSSTHADADADPVATRPPALHSERVVIVSASVGGGHDGAANELRRRLTDRGMAVKQVDFLDLVPSVRALTTAVFSAMLRWAPWTYELTYRALNRSRLLAAIASALMWAGRRRMRQAIPPDTAVVISTYPMSSQVLGWLRRKGRLDAPTATFLTDFSVHRLWVAEGIDMHLALHEVPAAQARRRGAANVVVSGSLVATDFRPLTPHQRAVARRAFDLPAHARLALLVGGSWGVGDIFRAAQEISEAGEFVPVVVTGQNAALRHRLQASGIRYAFGWVDDMPQLVGSVDVVVQNAGGLTSLEALAAGVPVISYRCIPGHGRTNAAALEEAGMACWVKEKSDLASALNEVISGPRGRRQRSAARGLAETNPADRVAEVVAKPVSAAPASSASRSRVPRRLAVAAAALTMLGWSGTYGTRLAVAHGLDAVGPRGDHSVYLVIHPRDALDAQTITMLRSLNVGVAIDSRMIKQQGQMVRQLAAADVVLINAGRGQPYRTGLVGGRAAIRQTANQLTPIGGHAPRLFLTTADVDAVDLGLAEVSHERLIVPTNWSRNSEIPAMHPGDVVLIECFDSPSCQAVLTLAQQQAQQQSLTLRSVAGLGG